MLDDWTIIKVLLDSVEPRREKMAAHGIRIRRRVRDIAEDEELKIWLKMKS